MAREFKGLRPDEEYEGVRYEDLTDEQRQMLDRMAQSATAAGNASVAARPQDPAFWMLLDGHTSTPVVHRDGCYICEDAEFAQMGLPLCRPCPECIRRRQACGACKGSGSTPDHTPCTDCLAGGFTGGLGHVPADDDACDECGEQDGEWNYDDQGFVIGLPPEQAIAIWNVMHPGSPR